MSNNSNINSNRLAWLPTTFAVQVAANKETVWERMPTWRQQCSEPTALIALRNAAWQPLWAEYQRLLIMEYPEMSSQKVEECCMRFADDCLTYREP